MFVAVISPILLNSSIHPKLLKQQANNQSKQNQAQKKIKNKLFKYINIKIILKVERKTLKML